MKKIVALLLSLGLVISFSGCSQKDTESKKPNQNQEIVSETESTNQNQEIVSETDDTISEKENTVIESRLPTVKFSKDNKDVRFRDMTDTADGGFAIAGVRYTANLVISIIQTYDKDANFIKQYTFNTLQEFSGIASCSDGGFIVSTASNPPYIIKLNKDFKVEWSKLCDENEDYLSGVYAVEEISSDKIAVLYTLFDQNYKKRTLKLAILNKDGTIAQSLDLTESVDLQDPKIIADGKGGFYIFTSCDKELAQKYPAVAQKYDSSKGIQAAVLHFNSKLELDLANTLGGEGQDWVEEAAIDNEGNIYIAIGTNWNGSDSLWDMSVHSKLYRRMLVKLNTRGEFVYKVPLANKGRAVDEVLGIHIKDNKTYVIGMADYFDGYQSKYPCEQIPSSANEENGTWHCVYNLCIDNSGKELDRKIFSYNINTEPCDSILLQNGDLVIAGSVLSTFNPFNLTFPSGVGFAGAIFVYKK